MKQIIQDMIHKNQIFALTNGENYASVESQIEENDEGLPIEVMCIWSSEDKAKTFINEEWVTYQISTIPLNEFLEDWCIGIFNDGLAFCINLDDEQDSFEVQPLELANKIAKEIEFNKIEIKWNNYKDIVDYISTIKPYILEE